MADGGGGISPWYQRQRLPVILQDEIAECALACLAMVATYFRYDIDLPSLRRRFDPSSRGMNLAQLIEVAHSLNLESRAAKVRLEDLRQVRMPCILHWNLSHFVVLKSITRRGALIHDPSRGKVLVPISQLSQKYTGIVLELFPSANFSPKVERKRVSLRALTGDVRGFGRVAIQVLGIALALEFLSLILPFQLQWVVDQAMVTADVSLLAWITLAFIVVLALQTSLNVVRAWILSWLGANLSAQWSKNLAAHLLRLPLTFFGRRDMGEIMSRFSSVQYIQNTLTGAFAEVVLNGITGIFTFVILLFYSVTLTAIVLGVLSVYVISRLVVYRQQNLANEEQIVYTARQQSLLMECIRGMQAIKLANKEGERSARIAGLTLAAAAKGMRYRRLEQFIGAFNHGLFGFQRILLIGLGGLAAIRGHFSAGMLIAFVTYSDQFVSRIAGLVDRLVEFRLLRLHGERIADIAGQRPESVTGAGYSGSTRDASITLHDLGFRYGTDSPWIFRNLNLTIESGESVAIIGPSGCGKSTLVKVIVGLLSPVEGQVELGGIDVNRFGLANFRGVIGTVMQNDHLFAGSIADNISFFDTGGSLESVIQAAKAAHVHDEIMEMTMGYETLVGEMGAALSGGQLQRIILARALYRQPRILLLDEATSHLDVDLERRINSTVSAGKATRIIIAHRPDTIASANRVVDLRNLSMSPLR